MPSNFQDNIDANTQPPSVVHIGGHADSHVKAKARFDPKLRSTQSSASAVDPHDSSFDDNSSSDSAFSRFEQLDTSASTMSSTTDTRSPAKYSTNHMGPSSLSGGSVQPSLYPQPHDNKPLPSIDSSAFVNGGPEAHAHNPPQHAPPPPPNSLPQRNMSGKRNSLTSTNGRPSLQLSAGEPVSPISDISNTAGTPPRSAAPSDLSIRQTPSPHRFSSASQHGNPTQSTSSLQAPAPGSGLKQRHTLEVPKAAAGRSSTSNEAYTSGRYSTTAAPTGTEAGGRRASLSLGRRHTRSIHSEMPRDEILPDDDASRWAEAYRQKRARRKRREEEDEEKVLVGTKVDETHANWTTAYNMLTGIRVSVSRTNAKLDRPLTNEDFEAKQKSTFDIAGNELVPSAKYDFKFKDYAPWVFRHLRALFRLDPADYLMSLTGKYILSELGSPGKSGSFFYFSRDYKYIIKTIHHAEHKFLRKVLKDYYNHVTDNPNTLLSQFYGLHRVKMPYGKKIHFVVMNNLFPPHRDIHSTFDLKGSTVGRDYREEELEKNPRATLKDLNWLRRKRHLELGLQKKQLFVKQLQEDVKLLQKLKIMDYSLLIGIHDLRKGNDENLRDKTLQVFNPGSAKPEDPQAVLMRTPSKLESARKARELRQMIKAERPVPMGQSGSKMPSELQEGQARGGVFYSDDGGLQATHEDNTAGDEVYYLGVIDCLTHYGMIKKIENFWKGLSSDKTQISALPPQEYGDRFLKFMSGITMSAEEAERDERDREAAAAAAAIDTNTNTHEDDPRQSGSGFPPAPTYLPPPPPDQRSRGSPEANPTVERAMRQATLSEEDVAREDEVPERYLTSGRTSSGAVLPIVEETAEAGSTGGRRSRSGSRPFTPAHRQDGYTDLGPHGLGGRGPPTPPKSHFADIGGRKRSGSGGEKVLDRNSLDKALPPVPT